MLDITDRVEAEARLRKAEADFMHATRLATLGELVASIAHEVTQPLAAIVINAQTILRWLLRAEPNIAEASIPHRVERTSGDGYSAARPRHGHQARAG